jgi:hypothetical protein
MKKAFVKGNQSMVSVFAKSIVRHAGKTYEFA